MQTSIVDRTTDKYVWAATASKVVPKAVDYAQGALGYFFRGRLDFVSDPNDLNGFLIKNLGPEDLNGTFELYYDDAQGNRHHFGTDQTIAVPASLPGQPPGTQPFQISFPPDPTISDCMVVFRGTLGLESEAVAVTYAHVVSGPFVHALSGQSDHLLPAMGCDAAAILESVRAQRGREPIASKR
jgi:hypothetical protein